MKISIPKLKQESNYTCLPACVRIILDYFNCKLSEKDISIACNTTKAGTLLNDSLHAIQSFGFNVTQIQDGMLDDLFQSIVDGEPVIVIIGVEHLPYGDFGTHAVVVNGFEDNDIIFVDPGLGKEMRMNIIKFLNAWQSREKSGIIIHHQ